MFKNILGILSIISIASISIVLYSGNNQNQNQILGDGFYNLSDSPSLESLSDVNISLLGTDDILQYDGSEWVNGQISGTGAGSSIWATSTDNTALYYNDSYVLVVGATATTTAVGQRMEIVGGLLTDEATTTGLTINGERFTDLTGTGLQNSAGVLTLNATGDWTGTFDGQQGIYYLARANHTGTQSTSTITGLFDSTNIADNYLLNTGDTGNGTYTFGTTTTDYLQVNNTSNFDGAVTGISLSEIEDLTDDKVFTMANKTLIYRFTNPDGGILWDWTGNATGHLWELNQNTGNPSAGTHMAHIQAADNDVLLMHLVHTGTPTAGYFSIDTTDDASSAGDVLFVNSNGYLGLNDATPSYLLDVNGDARIVGTATTTNLEVITNSTLGTIISGTWNGTDIDISDYTNLAVGAVGLSLTGDSIELTAGYNIPLTASTTEWDTSYSWGNHATAGYNLQSYASSTYVWASDWTTIDNYPTGCTNQFVRTIGDTLTCATIDVSSDTNLGVTATGIELSGDNIALSSGYEIPLTASTTNWENTYDWQVKQPTFKTCIASTSEEFVSGGQLPLPMTEDAYTVTDYVCHTVGGTSVVLFPTDLTNDMDSVTCDSDGQSDDGTIANASVTALEPMYLEFGTVTGAVNYVCISIYIN